MFFIQSQPIGTVACACLDTSRLAAYREFRLWRILLLLAVGQQATAALVASANPHRAPKAHDEWVDGRTGYPKEKQPQPKFRLGLLLVTRTGIEPMFSP